MCRRCIFVAILTLSLALAGCGAMNHSAGSGSHGDLPTLLLVTRSGAPPDHLLPLFGGSADAAAVQRLYRAMYALPRIPPGAVTSCPADFGIVYTLTFMDSSGTPILTARLDATGCQFLRLSDGDTCMTDGAFWSLLARTAGIPAAGIHSVLSIMQMRGQPLQMCVY